MINLDPTREDSYRFPNFPWERSMFPYIVSLEARSRRDNSIGLASHLQPASLDPCVPDNNIFHTRERKLLVNRLAHGGFNIRTRRCATTNEICSCIELFRQSGSARVTGPRQKSAESRFFPRDLWVSIKTSRSTAGFIFTGETRRLPAPRPAR